MTAQPVAAAPAWKFSFFDAAPVKDVHDLGSSPEIFRKAPEISAVISTTVGSLVADIHGSVYQLNRDFETTRSWLAHTGGRVTHMAERKSILITLGEEDSARHPFLKVWDLENADKTGAPTLLRSTKVQSGNRPHPVSTIALSAALSFLAIGLGDGTVLLYRHLDQSIFSGSTSLTSLPKPRVIHESPAEPITGLGFKEPDEDNPNVYLFIVTTNHVLTYQASGKGSGSAPAVVDEVGCGLGCATMDWRAKNMVVARDEAIYVCGIEGRGACYAYEGSKSLVHTHLNYMVIVTPPFVPTASAASGTVRDFVAKSSAGSVPKADITKVTIFDLENHFVAYSGTFTEGVRAVISAWKKIYVLSNDGKLSCLEEIPTSAKLDMLYRKSLYHLALNLAETQHLDQASVADIHRQFGDHLYTKGDYDGAMQQFVKTIGNVQPSYVIRKFLDAQRIHNLVTYLQELHALGLANSDHTTLLLNTYTKLKDVSRLDSFIKREARRASDGGKDELPFDLDTAIRVCRQAGYFEHASYLAKKYERHEDYLRIQIEDAGNYKDALMYLRRLGTEAAEANLARYGRAMLDSLPEETTQLLMDICTSLAPLSIEAEEQQSPATRQPSAAAPSYLSYLAINRGAPSASSETAVPSSASMTTVRPGDPIPPSRRDSLHDVSRVSTPPPGTPTTATPAKARATSVKRPSPKLYFAHFVDHRDHFVRFLETVALRRWGQSTDAPEVAVEADPDADEQAEKRDQTAVWNTLLELYLEQADANAEAESGGGKVLSVLQSTVPYDPTHALILCSTRSFTPGLVLLWERMGMHEDVLRFWMERAREGAPGASAEVVHRLDTYGEARPQLYALVLRFLTSTQELLAAHSADVQRILRHVDEAHIMHPLGVVQVLSRNGVTSVGLVKQWLIERITQGRDEVQMDQQLISSYRSETQAKLKQVEELSDPERPRVFHVTQCSACGGQLDLPSVHFMCNHSYHQRCLPEQDTECPNCARAHALVREIRRNNARLAGQHELFLSEVREGGFASLAAGFARGSMNVAALDDVDALA